MSYTGSFGRWADKDHTRSFFARQPDPTVRQAAPGLFAAADDNADVDLCILYEATTGRKWRSRNQNPRGFCVGFGNAKMAGLAMAMMAHAGEMTWPGADVAVEPIYGGMRFEVGYKTYGSDIARGGDGGVGSWAAEWLLKWGVILMQPTGNVDFTNYSMARCDQYGSRGVPDDLEPEAKKHPIQKMALCESASDCWTLIGQYHPIVHCSNQGFAMRRNKDGTCDANDVWPHCASLTGRFTLPNGDQTLRYDNSWDGDNETGEGYLGNAITVPGKNGEIHLNGNQFLVHMETVDRICKRGEETYSLTGPLGFTMRRPFMIT